VHKQTLSDHQELQNFLQAQDEQDDDTMTQVQSMTEHSINHFKVYSRRSCGAWDVQTEDDSLNS